MKSFIESSGAVGLKSADPVSKHRTAQRIFYSLLGIVLLVALLPVVPVAAAAPAAARPHAPTTASAYVAVTPVRLMDTRDSGGHLGAGGLRDLTVAGVTPGAPLGATSVVLNVTATNTTTGSFLTVYPAGTTRPLASNLNWVKGKTIPNLVSVPVGSAGAVTFYNAKGNVDVAADLEGYFIDPGTSTAGGEVALTPARITDTRTGSGKANAGSHLGAGTTLTVQVTTAGGVPAAGVSGAILNFTVTNTTASSFLTVWPTGANRPIASNLNWVKGLTIPNRVFVPVGTGGKVSVFNAKGSTDVTVDVSGYFTDATASGALFTPMFPTRIIDTRPSDHLGPNGTRNLQIGGVTGVPTDAKAAILNVTATDTTTGSFLTVYPSTATRPLASDLNWTPGVTIPNLTVATLGTTGAITFFNAKGNVDVVADIFGYFGASAGVSAGVVVTANPSSIPADGSTTSTVTATVTQANGTAAVGDLVNFTSSGAACNGFTTTNPTDGTGNASVTYTASTTAGICTITATEANNGHSGSTTITQTAVANTITTTATPPSILADGTSTSQIASTVLNGVTSAGVVGDVVSYTLSPNTAGACGTLAAATETTAGGGVTPNDAYTSSTTTGFCTVTSTEAGTGSSTKTVITQSGTATIGITVTAVPGSIPADGKSTSKVTATLTGAGIAGDPVAFTVSGSGGKCGTVSPTFTNANASGIATTTYTASTDSDDAGLTCTVTASEANGGSSAFADITQTTVPNKITLTAAPSNVAADGSSTSKLTATVTSGVTGLPVAADTVGFSSPAVPACGTITPGSAPTDASGVATATYMASTTIGFCAVTADAGGGSSATTTINQQSAAANNVSVSAVPTSIPADGSTTSAITAKVKNISGGPVVADTVSFVTSGAACALGTPNSATTDSLGAATITYTASTTVGICTITATEASAGKTGSTTVTQTKVLNQIAMSNDGPILADGTSTASVTAAVTNGGVAVGGDVVHFTMSAHPAGACGTLSATSATTVVITGLATVTYTASNTVGFCTVTGTEATDGSSDSTVITQNGAGTTNAITVTAVPSNLPADGRSTSTITATVTGVGSAGDQVAFTMNPNVAGGCGTLSSAFATTNGGGVATVTYTAGLGTTSGASCIITASEANSGSSGSANITQNPVKNSLTISANPTTIKGDGISTSTITAHVTNGVSGAPEAGDVVTFDFDDGHPPCGSYVSATATTDASGNATATYTSAAAPGTFCHLFASEANTGVSNSPATDAVITQTS